MKLGVETIWVPRNIVKWLEERISQKKETIVIWGFWPITVPNGEWDCKFYAIKTKQVLAQAMEKRCERHLFCSSNRYVAAIGCLFNNNSSNHKLKVFLSFFHVGVCRWMWLRVHLAIDWVFLLDDWLWNALSFPLGPSVLHAVHHLAVASNVFWIGVGAVPIAVRGLFPHLCATLH